MLAIIASLLLISIYIGFRFEFKFAVPVLIALAHDLLITAGVYALFDREVTTATVAALLTIMGYSLYDTVIVFDRIRENVPRMPRATFSQIANRSMSEVFTRSLATSFVVLMPVGALLLFGGETLQGLRLRAAGRRGVGRLLVDLHRHAGARGVEGARADLHAPPPLILREHGGGVPAFATRRDRRAGAGRRGAAAATAAPAEATAEQPPRARRAAGPRGAGGAGLRRGAAGHRRGASADAGRGSRPRPRAARRQRRAGTPRRSTSAPEPTARRAGPRPEPDPAAPREPAGAGLKPAAAAPADDGAPPAGRRAVARDKHIGPGQGEAPLRVPARSTGGAEHGTRRLGDDGNRGLALHGVLARPLLGRHRRRLPGGDA